MRARAPRVTLVLTAIGVTLGAAASFAPVGVANAGPRPAGSSVAAVATAELAISAATATSSAKPDPLAALRRWAADADRRTARTAVGGARGENNATASALATLGALVPELARRLDATPVAARAGLLRAAQLELDGALAPVYRRLDDNERAFFFTDYQSELERMAIDAHLDRAPTGRILTAGYLLADPKRYQAAVYGTGGGAPGTYDSKVGWGIPDRLLQRQAWDTRGGFRPCVFVTEAIPDFRDEAAAVAWYRTAAAHRDCAPPVSGAAQARARGGAYRSRGRAAILALGRKFSRTSGSRLRALAGDCPVKPDVDTDGDGVPDCTELAGFDFKIRIPGEAAPKVVHTASNPADPNTDNDAITVAGKTYALPDGQEWQASVAGGVSDPNSRDSDTDGLTDVEEIARLGTNPAALDSDSDSIGPDGKPDSRLFDGGEVTQLHTDPTNPDTDGDGRTDYQEVVIDKTNPLVAQVPEFQVTRSPTASGVQIAIPEAQTSQAVTTTLTSESSSSSRTDQHTDTTVHTQERNVQATLTGGCKDCTLNGGMYSITAGSKWTDGTTTQDQTTVTQQSQRMAQQTYQESLTKALKETGTLSATFDVTNTGRVPFQLRNLQVLANAICLPAAQAIGGRPGGCLNPGQVTTVAALVPKNVGPTGITLDAGRSQTFQFSADVATPILRSLMANPGNLTFVPSSFDLLNSDGSKNFADLIGRSIDTNTGGVTIDFGDGRVEHYSVATNVARKWGDPLHPAGITAKQILSEALVDDQHPDGVPYATTSQPGRPQQILTKVRDKQALPVAGNKNPGSWLVLGSAQGLDDKTNFDDVTLKATQQLTLAYLADADGDGLFDREEKLLGTSDSSPDTDGDGLTDYQEAKTGWTVPYPDEAHGYQVYSSPLSCDADHDGSPDGPGPGNSVYGYCPSSSYPSESQRKTDPTNPDTNANGILDGADPQPLLPPEQPVGTGSWTGAQLTATGGRAIENSWELGAPNQTILRHLALCGAGDASSGCGPATGYYRVTWSITSPRSSWDATPHGALDDRTLGDWSVTSQNPGEQTPTSWLSASLQASETDPDQSQAHALYIHLPATQRGVDLTFTDRLPAGRAINIDALKLETVSKADYLRAGYRPDGSPDPAFAAIAVPAQDLGHVAEATNDGPQGIRLDPAAAGKPRFTLPDWGPGLDLPEGGYRAGFALRIDNNSVNDAQVATPSVTQGGAAPAQESAYERDSDGLPAPSSSRYALASGFVWRGDFARARQDQTINLLFEQHAPSQNVSLPVAVSPSSGGLALDNVVIDRTPYARGYVWAGGAYSGLGTSAWPLHYGGSTASTVFNPYETVWVDPQFVKTNQARSWEVGIAGVPTGRRVVSFASLVKPLYAYDHCSYLSVVAGESESEFPHFGLPPANQLTYERSVEVGGDRGPPGEIAGAIASFYSCPPTEIDQLFVFNRPATPGPGATRNGGGARGTAPGGRVSLARTVKARVTGRGAGVFALRCAGPSLCSGTYQIVQVTGTRATRRLRVVGIARGRYAVRARRTANVAFRLTPAGRALLGRRGGRLRATLVLNPNGERLITRTLVVTSG